MNDRPAANQWAPRAVMRYPLVVAGAGLVVALVAVGALAPLLAPHDPRALVGESLERPSAGHLLGTNDVGQDILSQVIWGSRAALITGIVAAVLALAVAIVVGVGAGLLGGLVDLVAMRVVDAVLALPVLPLLVVVAALAGPDRTTVVLTIGFLGWPPAARILRSQTLTLRQRGFVAAARGFGARPTHVVRRHLVPALGPLLVTTFVTWAGIAIALEAGLAFLGLGDPTSVSWGTILNRALDHQGIYFTALWTWWVLPAGFAITLAVLGFTLLGVGLEPIMNPRLARTT